MADKVLYIKIYLTQDEKSVIEKIADKRKDTLSSVVKSFLPITGTDEDLLAIALSESFVKQDRPNDLHFDVSDEEYKAIKENAGQSSIAAYLRKVAIEGSHPISLSVNTNDVTDMTEHILPLLQKVYDQNRFMVAQSFMQPQQFEKISGQLQAIEDELVSLNKEIRSQRQSIKKEELSYLRQRIRYERKKLKEGKL